MKVYQREKMKFGLVLYIVLLVVFRSRCHAQECSPGISRTQPQTFPVCPGSQVSYTCTVAGTNFTAWTGSSFYHFCNNTFNETIIANYYNDSTGNMNMTFANMSECGPFVAIRDDDQTRDGCYVSDLEFIASNTAIFNNTSIQCLDGDGEEIGIETVKVAGPPTIPLNIWLDSCNGPKRTLVLNWESPASDGGNEIVRYALTGEPQIDSCNGICYVNASTTQFQFGPLNSDTEYTFTVHAENCNGTQQGDQSNVTVYYGGPAGPPGLSASLVYQEDELVSIISTWEEKVPLDDPTQCNLPVIGFEISYISYFTNPVTLNISLDRCFGGVCSHTYDIVDFDIPMYTLSVASKSELGAGPPTLIDLISAKNDFVNITVNASTPYPKAACQFLCGLGDETVTAKCGISYSTDVAQIGQSNSFTDAPITNGSMGETLSFPLTEPLPPNTVYYYQVNAFTTDHKVTVNGNFTTGNYSAKCSPAQLLGGNISRTNSTMCENGNKGVVSYDTNLILCYNGLTHSSVAKLQCRKGYDLENGSLSQASTCQVNGLWDYYPTTTCRKGKDTAAIIGGSVGGVLGILLLIAVCIAIPTLYKYRNYKSIKSIHRKTNTGVAVVMYNYSQGKYGASEKLSIVEGVDDNPLTAIS